MRNEPKSLIQILDIPEAERLQAAIAAKGRSPVLDRLADPEMALRFIRSTLRGSYLFARFAVPSYAAAVFAVLKDFPPVDDGMGRMLERLMEAVKGELFNNNIFEREGECHSHFHDALEAYAAAGGDAPEVASFERRAHELGFDQAMEGSAFWSSGSIRYAQALKSCCADPLALFILMPANEELAPRVYARALATLSEEARFSKFRRFFARHVALDEDDHGPAALDWLELYLKQAGHSRARIRLATGKVLAYIAG